MRILTILCVSVILCVFVGTRASGYRNNSTAVSEAAGGQDTVYLDRRISLLETRLNSIESSLRTLQQQAMSQRSVPSAPSRDVETQLLRGEVELLKSRLREIECGLVHVDERTLSPAAREARKRAGGASDPCRLNSETPVELSPRR